MSEKVSGITAGIVAGKGNKMKKVKKFKKKTLSSPVRGQFVSGQQVDLGLATLSGDVTCEEVGHKSRKKRKRKGSSDEPQSKKRKKGKKRRDTSANSDSVITPATGDVTSSRDDDVMASPSRKCDMRAWDKHHVPAPVLRALQHQGFSAPMPIQTLALPAAIRDRLDVIGAAETGSGKTLAFGIPVLASILRMRELPASKRGDDSLEPDEDPAGNEDAEDEDKDEEEENEEGDKTEEDEKEIDEERQSEDEELAMEEESDEDSEAGDPSVDLPEGFALQDSEDAASDDSAGEEAGSEEGQQRSGEESDEGLVLNDDSDAEEEDFLKMAFEGASDDDDDVDDNDDNVDDDDENEDDDDDENGNEPEDSGRDGTESDMDDAITNKSDLFDEVSLEEGDFDLPPTDDDLSELGEGQLGCVRFENNLPYDLLEMFAAKMKKDAIKDLSAKKGSDSSERSKKKSKSGSNKRLHALILTPTRELAIQVKNHIQAAAKFTDIKVCCVVGGMAVAKQERLLGRRPEIVVATPGRLWQLLQEGEPHLATAADVNTLVIDEADRMVEKGHFAELLQLLQMLNADAEKRERRQTFIFSATLTLVHSGPTRHIKKRKKMTTDSKLSSLMEQIGVSPKAKVIDLTGSAAGVSGSLTEATIHCTHADKDVYLYYLLHSYAGRTLVFANSKDSIRRLVSILTLLQCHPLPLHADMHQRQRLKNLDKFTANPRGLLLATDVAARGLDIRGVGRVIHFQVPKSAENYVHRSGRTARAANEGLSVMLVSAEEARQLSTITRTLKRPAGLPAFPVEQEFMPAMRERVTLALQIDKAEHRIAKVKAKNSWFERAAREMDIDISDDVQLLDDVGDERTQALHRDKMAALRYQLSALLSAPVTQRYFSGKYPTKSGSFAMPYMQERQTVSALSAIKAKQTAKNAQTAAASSNKRKFNKRKRR